MSAARAKQHMVDIVRQLSQSEGVAPAMRDRSQTEVQRSASERGNIRRRSRRWSRSSSIICRVTKVIQQVRVHDDHIMQIIRLECPFPDRSQFLAVVCNEAAKEYCLLGIDCNDEKEGTEILRIRSTSNETLTKCKESETIGLVMKLSSKTVPNFTGDGGFKIKYNKRSYLFKPVSLQALWKLIQTLHIITERGGRSTHRSGSIGHERTGSIGSVGMSLENLSSIPEINLQQDIVKHDWTNDYEERKNSPQFCINYWERFEDILSKRPPSTPYRYDNGGTTLYDEDDVKTAIKFKLRRIMRHVDLDRITSRAIRKNLENEMGENLDKYRTFIDEEILLVLGQLDQSSKILDYLYLGSEWNAQNLEELTENKITHILNVTREIDNFFPGTFKYKNIRVWDLETTRLIERFDETYKFIKEAKDQNGTVLVHCKMGMSRSASSVIAFIMKEYGMNNEEALEKVRKARPIIQPNEAFASQLVEYNGILHAKKDYRQSLNKHSARSSSPSGDYCRKTSAKERCKDVHVKDLARTRFSHPVGSDKSEAEDEDQQWQRTQSVKTKITK